MLRSISVVRERAFACDRRGDTRSGLSLARSTSHAHAVVHHALVFREEVSLSGQSPWQMPNEIATTVTVRKRSTQLGARAQTQESSECTYLWGGDASRLCCVASVLVRTECVRATVHVSVCFNFEVMANWVQISCTACGHLTMMSAKRHEQDEYLRGERSEPIDVLEQKLVGDDRSLLDMVLVRIVASYPVKLSTLIVLGSALSAC